MTAKGSSTQIVLDALRDLHQQEQIVTRETLQAFTGLKLPIIDDRIRALVEEGLAIRVQRGVFVPAEVHPPARPMTKTLLPDGTVNLEIGDHVIILTPAEDRMLARIQAGVMMQAATIEVGHQAALLHGEIQGRLNRVERSIAKAADGASQGVTLDAIAASQGVTGVTLGVTHERHQSMVVATQEKQLSPGAKRTARWRQRKLEAAQKGVT
ncbi:hypothetical protein NDO41_16415 [Ectopseudomonas mendocina]|nr:hypothetical protein NDO41_16415 [Pseudomonas mendocina]